MKEGIRARGFLAVIDILNDSSYREYSCWAVRGPEETISSESREVVTRIGHERGLKAARVDLEKEALER